MFFTIVAATCLFSLVSFATAAPARSSALSALSKRGLDSQLVCVLNADPAFKGSWLTAARCKTRTTYEAGCAIKESSDIADKVFQAACPRGTICLNVDRPGAYVINVPAALQGKVKYKTLVEAAPDVLCRPPAALKGQTAKRAGSRSAMINVPVTPKPGDEAYLWQVICAKTTLNGILHTTGDLTINLFVNNVLQVTSKPGQWYVTHDVRPGSPRVTARCEIHGNTEALLYGDSNIRDPSPSGI